MDDEHRILLLARIVQHLRDGLEFSIAGPSSGRVVWSSTAFALLHPEGFGEPSLMIRTSVRSRSGRVTTQPWTHCDWTIDDLMSLCDEADEQDAVVTGLDDVRDEDPVVADILRLGSEPVTLAAHVYRLDDGSISVETEGGVLEAPKGSHHPADEWICRRLSPAQEAAIGKGATAN